MSRLEVLWIETGACLLDMVKFPQKGNGGRRDFIFQMFKSVKTEVPVR